MVFSGWVQMFPMNITYLATRPLPPTCHGTPLPVVPPPLCLLWRICHEFSRETTMEIAPVGEQREANLPNAPCTRKRKIILDMSDVAQFKV